MLERTVHNFLASIQRRAHAPNFGRKLLFLISWTCIFSAGVLQFLLASKALVVGQPNFINDVLGIGSLRLILIATGIALVASSMVIFPYIRRILNRNQTIRLAATHHVRNKVQDVLLSLERLKQEESTTESQRERIFRAEDACKTLIDTLSEIEESGGDKIDYALVVKNF